MFGLASLLLLALGGLLETAGIAFWGLDGLIGLCFLGAMTLGGLGAMRGPPRLWAIVSFGVAALALGLHLCLNLGLLG